MDSPLSQSISLPATTVPLPSLPNTVAHQLLGSQPPAGIYEEFPSQNLSSQSFDAATQFPQSQRHTLAMPDSQLPDSSSQPTQNPDSAETPSLPHFVPASFLSQIPTASQSSAASEDERTDSAREMPEPASKAKSKKKLKPKKHPSALTRVESRKAKHGKRVRFDDNLVVVSTPPRKKYASSHSPSPSVREALCSQLKQSDIGTNNNNIQNENFENVPSPPTSPPQSPAESESMRTLSPKLDSNESPRSSTGKKKPVKVNPKQQTTLERLASKEMKSDSVKAEEHKDIPKPVVSPSQPSPWQTLEYSPDTCPKPRWGATFTPLDKKSVLLVGGESEATGFFDDTVIYDVTQQKWINDEKRPPPMPFPRAWHSATLIDHMVFVFGGEIGDEDGSVDSKGSDDDRKQCNNALVYDSTYRTWYTPSLTGTPPVARAGHCAALIPGSRDVLVFGGTHRSRWLNDYYILEDLRNWIKPRISQKSVKPSQRSYATLTTVNDYVVLFGGNNKRRCLNDVFLFDSKSRTWVQPVILGQTPKARTGHCAVALEDGRGVLIYGGWDDQGVERLFYSDVWMLRIESKTECQWTCVFKGDNSTKKPGPRAGAAMCSGVGEQQDQTLLFGGWYQVNHFNDIIRLHVSQNGRVRCASTQ